MALVTRDVLALIAQVDVLVEGIAEDDDLIKVLEAFLILSFKIAAISGVAFLEDSAGHALHISAHVESLALGKVRLAVILGFLKELLFHHLAVFHHIGFDLGVLGLFDLDPLDGVVQQISGKRYDVIVGHLKTQSSLGFHSTRR